MAKLNSAALNRAFSPPGLSPVWGNLFVACWVFCAALLLSCEAIGKQYTDNDSPDAGTDVPQRLEDRARAYWEARVAGDLVATYEFEADNVSGALTLSQYVRKKGNIVYKHAKVISTEVVGKVNAVANLVVEAIVPGLPGSFKSEFKDDWVFIGGLWYHGSDRS